MSVGSFLAVGQGSTLGWLGGQSIVSRQSMRLSQSSSIMLLQFSGTGTQPNVVEVVDVDVVVDVVVVVTHIM